MILLNNAWENINSISDVIRYIRREINSELADTIQLMIPEHSDEDYFKLDFKLATAETKIESLEDEILSLNISLEDKNREIERLHKEMMHISQNLNDILQDN